MTIEFQARPIQGQHHTVGGGFLIADGEDERPILIVNTDTQGNALFLGRDQSVDLVKQVNSVPLAAGQVIVLDGKTPTYIAALVGGGSNVAIYPGGIEYDTQG